MPINTLPVREVRGRDDAPTDSWPYTLPPVRQLLADGLRLGPLTVLVGENGTGKSTILEAIAMAFGLNPAGGSAASRFHSRSSESSLHAHLELTRGVARSRRGYFLRAETMYELLTYLEANPSTYQPEPQYHERSHGQAFNELVAVKLSQMRQGGFLILDEPEAGLSFQSQIRLAQRLANLPDDGVQVLMATHSPILAALPDADIYELDADGYEQREWRHLLAVAQYRRFLVNPADYGLGPD